MTATRPPLAKVDLRRNKEGGNVKGRVVRMYRKPWNTQCVLHGEPGMKDPVRQYIGSSAIPPSMTGLTGPRINLDEFRIFFVGAQVSKTQVRLENEAGTPTFFQPESEMKSQFLRLETGNG